MNDDGRILGVTLTGVDGSTWNLRNGPVQLTNKGIGGFNFATPVYQKQETARVHGSRSTSWKLDERPVRLPLKWNILYAHDIEGIQRQFWDAIFSDDLNEQCVISVTDAGGSVRSITVRFVDDGNIAYALDPYTWQDPFSLTMVAEDPFWYGEVVPSYFEIGTSISRNFFGGGDVNDTTGGGPPFYISAGRGDGRNMVRNPGRVDAWPKWTLKGIDTGITTFTVGVGDHLISGNFPIASTDVLEIYTDPTNQVAYLNGVLVTRRLLTVDFAPIPAGEESPVVVQVLGKGSVLAEIRPQYMRAF